MSELLMGDLFSVYDSQNPQHTGKIYESTGYPHYIDEKWTIKAKEVKLVENV